MVNLIGDWLADTFLLRFRIRLHQSLIARAPLYHCDIFYNQVRLRHANTGSSLPDFVHQRTLLRPRW